MVAFNYIITMCKRLILTACLFIPFLLCNAQQKLPKIIIKNKYVKVDTIPFNIPITIDYVFKNTGKSDLIIKNIITSCGCASAEYPKTPIKKRKKGIIKLIYNAGTKGSFYKTLLVESNATNSPTPIAIQGFVF